MVAALPGIAAALDGFAAEAATRPRERLDLVSWVQHVCGFGGGGPAREAWWALFQACCFEEHGEEGGRRGVLALGVVDVAVLLAFSRCCGDEAAAGMTDHNLVKGRVRPAVEGRSCQARTPGILPAVEDAFDEFMYGFVGRGLLEAAKRDLDVDEVDDGGEGGEGGGDGSSVDRRDYAMCEVRRLAVRCVRDWELVMRTWLRVALQPPRLAGACEPSRERERRRVFLSARADARTQLRDAFFRKLSVRLWRREPASYIGATGAAGQTLRYAWQPPRPVLSGRQRAGVRVAHAPQYSRLSFDSSAGGEQGDSSRSLRSVGMSTLGNSAAGGGGGGASPGRRLSWDSLSTVSGAGLLGSGEGGVDAARAFDALQRTICSARGVLRRLEILDALARDQDGFVAVAEVRFRVLELHAPCGGLSEASLEFLPSDACDIVPRSEMHPACPSGVAAAGFERTACFRLAGAESCLGSVEVGGARPSARCRALEIVVEVVEVPAGFGEEDEGGAAAACGIGGRFRFRQIRAEWVELDGRAGREDDCEQLEPQNEILNDEWEDPIYNNMGGTVSRESRTARHLMTGAAMVYSTIDVADDVFHFPVRFHAPRRRRGGGAGLGAAPPATPGAAWYCAGEWMDESATEDGGGDAMDFERAESGGGAGDDGGVEELERVVQIDCSVGARMFFSITGGIECGTKPCAPERNIFPSAPVWLTREP